MLQDLHQPGQEVIFTVDTKIWNYVQLLATEFMFYGCINQLLHQQTGCSL